jgi:pSer/pThr/pTyr-binding forkhead associated (FHA) protein
MSRLAIGRSTTSDIIISDPSVSKVHAELYIDGNSVSVRDLGSTNGTYVNGNRIGNIHSLGQFDILKVGNALVPWRNYINSTPSYPSATVINSSQSQNTPHYAGTPQPIPNGTTTLVLGICSIVFSCVLIGLILGIISISIGSKGKKLYKLNPSSYTGYSALNAGYICGIVGTILGGLYILYYIIWTIILGAAFSSAFDIMKNI